MYIWGFPGSASGKEPASQYRRHKGRGPSPWVGKIPWGRAWQHTPVFLPRESHGQRSLAGYNPWGRKGWNMIEHIHTLYVCRSQSPNAFHTPFPPFVSIWLFSTFVSLQCLCLYFCFANRFVYTIFLDSKDMHSHMIFIFLFLTYL